MDSCVPLPLHAARKTTKHHEKHMEGASQTPPPPPQHTYMITNPILSEIHLSIGAKWRPSCNRVRPATHPTPPLSASPIMSSAPFCAIGFMSTHPVHVSCWPFNIVPRIWEAWPADEAYRWPGHIDRNIIGTQINQHTDRESQDRRRAGKRRG